MPNVFLEPDMVTAATLDHFENELTLAKYAVDRQWESKFGIEGAKIGDTLRLRRHNNFAVSVGNAFDPQGIDEAYRTLTIDTNIHVDFVVDNADMALTFDRAEERYFKPAGRALANNVEGRIAALYKKVSNFVGTYNTLPTALTDFSSAVARLDQFGVPRQDRSFILDPVTMNAAIVSMSALFNSQQAIGKQYMDGRMSNALNAAWRVDQNIAAHTSGALGGAPLVNVAPVSGDDTIDIDGWTANVANILLAGDIFTIAGVNAVNPITGADIGILRQFVVLTDQSSNNAGETNDVSIDPPIISSGPRKTVTALPANDAVLTMVTTPASTVANSPLYVHKHWAALAIVAEPAVRGVHASASKSDPDGGGIGLRYVMWWDGDTNQFKVRFDCLIGLVCQMPEFAVRLGTS